MQFCLSLSASEHLKLHYKLGYGSVEEYIKDKPMRKFSLLERGIFDRKCTRLLINGMEDSIFPIEDSMLALKHGRVKDASFWIGRSIWGSRVWRRFCMIGLMRFYMGSSREISANFMKSPFGPVTNWAAFRWAPRLDDLLPSQLPSDSGIPR